MKTNIKILSLVLIILIAVFAVVQFTKKSDRSKSFRSELVDIDTTEVTRIIIEEPSNKSELVREENGWVVKDGDKKYKAVSTSIRSMLSSLQTIKPTRIASRNESKWRDFNVDSTGTRVQVFQSEEKSLDIVLGRFGVEGQQKFFSYVRLFEEEDTYVADNFMKMSVSADNSSYRNSMLLKLNKDSVSLIDFQYPDSAFTLTKKNNQWVNNNEPLDSTSIANFISGISYITSRKFEEPVDDIPDLKVTFQNKNGSNYVLSAYRDDSGWVINSSENEREYFRDKTVFDKIFRSFSSFKVQ